jgi:hypothetical protein
MYRGRIVDTFDAASTSDDELLASATGASAARREAAPSPMGEARP